MNENENEKMNFPDTLRINKQARDQIVKSFAGFQATRATAEFCFFGAQDQDIKISEATWYLGKAIDKEVSQFEVYAQAERDRRWREDPLNLMPYLRFWGLRCRVADGLRAIADWIEG